MHARTDHFDGRRFFNPNGANGQPLRVYTRDPNAPYLKNTAKASCRIPSGHPEGYLEAFAQLYTDLAEQITAKIEKRSPGPDAMLVPGVADGVEGVKFINAVLESSRKGSAWTATSNSQ